jgi:L-threonylcarbamoyladenylate synthase
VATIGTDISQAKHLLENGLLVAIPTETVYGIAASAFDIVAVARIFEAKNRPTFDPLIVHTHSLEKVSEFVEDIHPKLLKLAQTFWPGL